MTGWRFPYAAHLGIRSADAPQFLHCASSPDPLAQIEYVAALGFRGITDNSLLLRPPSVQEAMGQSLTEFGLIMGSFVMDPAPQKLAWGLSGEEPRREILTKLDEAISGAKRVNGKIVNISSRLIEDLPISRQIETMSETMKWAADIAMRHDIILAIEPISRIRVDNMLIRHVDDVLAIIDAVRSDHIKLIFDTFHVYFEDGDILTALRRTGRHISTVQIADFPDRCEPGSGMLNFPRFFTALEEIDYRGLVELEYFHSAPGRDGEERALQALRSLNRS